MPLPSSVVATPIWCCSWSIPCKWLVFVYVFVAVFRPYAMPSAGFLPFLQTVMCDLGDDDKGGVVSDLPNFPNATWGSTLVAMESYG